MENGGISHANGPFPKELRRQRLNGFRVNMRRAPTVLCSWLLILLLEGSKVAAGSHSNVTWNTNTGPGLSSYQISVSNHPRLFAEDSCTTTPVVGLFQLDRSISLLLPTLGLAQVSV